MAQSTIHVVARLVARPETIEALKLTLHELVTATRQEAGCDSYELLHNNHDPTDFVFVEEWSSDEALDAHLSSAHMQAASVKAGVLLSAPPDIRRYRLLY